jgi:methylglutaconyl-CoA hydratase
VVLAKRQIAKVAHADIGPEIVEETARSIAEIRATPEAQEGLGAFLEKRGAAWVAPATAKKPKKR